MDNGQLPPVAQARLGEARQAGTWTSSLTVDEFAVLRSVGFEPVGQVMGSTVHNLGWWYRSSINCGYRPGLLGAGYAVTITSSPSRRWCSAWTADSLMVMEFDMVAAALRRDTSDLATYAGVLTGTLADALPPGCVTVEYERGLGDRLRGRTGRPRRIVVRLGERTLSLAADVGRPVAEIHHEVRGVVLSRDQVPLDVWVGALTEELIAQADADARAAEALRRLAAGG